MLIAFHVESAVFVTLCVEWLDEENSMIELYQFLIPLDFMCQTNGSDFSGNFFSATILDPKCC